MKFPKIFPVACHTDNIGPGSTFVAIQGMKEDGIKYIVLAVEKGATKVVIADVVNLDHATIQYLKKKNVKLVRAKNPRQSLAQLSAQAFDYPAKKLKIIGITGTKGKTTTSCLLEYLLQSAGYKTALLSSVHNKIDSTTFKTSLTTQHPDYLHVFFDQCVKEKIDFVVMEVAAQALSLERVYGLEFDGIIFTNFDQEHAEFYNTMDEYFLAKCKIFKHAKPNAPILINADDMWCQKILKVGAHILRQAQDERSEELCLRLLLRNSKDPVKIKTSNFVKTSSNSMVCGQDELKCKPFVVSDCVSNRIEPNEHMFSFSLKNENSTYQAQILKNSLSGLELKINNALFSCPTLFGEFNAYNILSAITLLKKLGIPSKKIQKALIEFQGVPGRLQIHELPNGARACIDKAHNPSSYQAILGTLRKFTDHLIVVFGCGGERDKTKRPLMGNIAAELCDVVIVTSDDPRSEDPEVIIKDILSGIKKDRRKIIAQLDRKQAIKIAYKYSRSTSIIALLGKGPEEYQLINGIKYYFSERSILQQL